MESIETNRGVARLDDYRRSTGAVSPLRIDDSFVDRRKLIDDLLILSDCLTVVTEILSRLTTPRS